MDVQHFFQNSTLLEYVEVNQIKLPNPETLSSAQSENMPFVIVADEAFALSPFIMLFMLYNLIIAQYGN